MGDDEVMSIFKHSDFTSSFKIVLGKQQENSADEESKSSITSANSGVGRYFENKENYEDNIDYKIEDIKSESEISDDYEDEDFTLGLSDSEASNQAFNTGIDTQQTNRRKKSTAPFNLNFKCEWKNCTYESNEESPFHVHVSYHIPDVEVKTLANGEEVYVCLWAECSYMTGGVKEIQRHVTYHSYHTKLKNVGEKIMEEWNLPKCQYGTETRNLIPDKIDPMICEWKDCNKEFINVQVFIHHLQMHINESCIVDTKTKKEKFKCGWMGCTVRAIWKERTCLTTHIRTHSNEKVVGCPVCGHLFATNSKLNDHCKRQQANESSQFQCPHCYKYFGSLRLLKDHRRGHVNYYKCCYCDMTCTSRHTYSAHIRYKHLDSKPFNCSLCEYSCKTVYDLQKHLALHDPKPQFECEEVDCNFSCRSKKTLQKHMITYHQAVPAPVYCCHLPDCNRRYKRGSYLTKHLMNKHCLRWPSGHSKFIYHRQEDGTFSLQTVRYESLKLYGENTSESPSKQNVKLKVDNTKSFKVSSIEPDSTSGMSQVFISIEDESGNTINCCTALEVSGEKIPKNAMIIATADNVDSDDEM